VEDFRRLVLYQLERLKEAAKAAEVDLTIKVAIDGESKRMDASASDDDNDDEIDYAAINRLLNHVLAARASYDPDADRHIATSMSRTLPNATRSLRYQMIKEVLAHEVSVMSPQCFFFFFVLFKKPFVSYRN
jgi:hypothetical protein